MLTKNCQIEVFVSKLRRRSEENRSNAQGNRASLSELEINDIENATAISLAKELGMWLEFPFVSKLGTPIPSGIENEVYLSADGNTVYKMNNLMISHSVLNLLERTLLHNSIFPQTRYDLYGFTGLGRNSIYPILIQDYIKEVSFATIKDIKDYMVDMGFKETTEATFTNEVLEISDLRPRNVLKDDEGDIFVIDANFRVL